MPRRNKSRARADRFGFTLYAFRLAFAAGLIIFAFALQFSTANLGSIDGYFHIRYSQLLWSAGWRGFPPAFPWLPLTILAPDRYYDHHLLFHLWLALFTTANLIIGAKIAAALGAAAAFLTAYGFLLRWQVRRAEWWMIALLAGAPGFLYRMEMPRVQSWSVVFLILAFHILLRRRDIWLLPVAWLYTWTYDAFPILLALCGCTALARGWTDRTLAWEPLACASAGVAGGLLVNPYFPANLRYIAHHYLAKIQMSAAVPVGNEWYPLPVADWLGWGGLVAIFAAGLLAMYRRRDDLTRERLTAILAAGFFLVLLWRAVRFVEYFVPFAAFALAFTLHERIDAAVAQLTERRRQMIAAALLVWLAVSAAVAVVQLRRRPPATRWQGVSAWLRTHTEPGTMVFSPDWDSFPLLFFHDTERRYVIGLDPTYLAERDAQLYESWQRIGSGRDPTPMTTMATTFGAPVAVTAHENGDFIATMEADPAAERIYEDDDGIVYRRR